MNGIFSVSLILLPSIITVVCSQGAPIQKRNASNDSAAITAVTQEPKRASVVQQAPRKANASSNDSQSMMGKSGGASARGDKNAEEGDSSKGGGMLIKVGGGAAALVLLIGIGLCVLRNKKKPAPEAPEMGEGGEAEKDVDGMEDGEPPGKKIGNEKQPKKKVGGSSINIKEKKKVSSDEEMEQMSQDGKPITAPKAKGKKDTKPGKKSIISKIKGKTKKLAPKMKGMKEKLDKGIKGKSPGKKPGAKPNVVKKKNIAPSNASMNSRNNNNLRKALKISENNNNPSTSFVISDKNDNNQSTASMVSERADKKPDTESFIKQEMNKRPELTALMKELKETLAKRNKAKARWNIIRHSMTIAKTPSKIRYTETTEITPLMSVKLKPR